MITEETKLKILQIVKEKVRNQYNTLRKLDALEAGDPWVHLVEMYQITHLQCVLPLPRIFQ